MNLLKRKDSVKVLSVPFPVSQDYIGTTATVKRVTSQGLVAVVLLDGTELIARHDRFLLHEVPKNENSTTSKSSAFSQQVGGNHYKTQGVQPLELTLKNLGYKAFVGACYTKINKYMTRKKDDEVEQLKKARHVLDMWIEEAEKKK